MKKFHILEYSIPEIIDEIKSNKFSYFDINKVEVCLDCQFRYCCVTNIERVEAKGRKTHFNKQECNYNPYIAKWEGEEGYRTLAECGVTSNEKEFSIDHKKIAKINEELWGE